MVRLFAIKVLPFNIYSNTAILAIVMVAALVIVIFFNVNAA
jgi:hypothetical protein